MKVRAGGGGGDGVCVHVCVCWGGGVSLFIGRLVKYMVLDCNGPYGRSEFLRTVITDNSPFEVPISHGVKKPVSANHDAAPLWGQAPTPHSHPPCALCLHLIHPTSSAVSPRESGPGRQSLGASIID